MKERFFRILYAFKDTFLYVLMMEAISSWLYFVNLEVDYYNQYYILIQSLVHCMLILFFVYITKNRRFRFLLDFFSVKWSLVAAVLGIVFVFVQIPLSNFYNVITGDSLQLTYEFNGYGAFFKLSVLSVAFFVPLYEELFFRSYIQDYLQEKITANRAMFLSAVLFALIHLPFNNLFLSYSNEGFYLTYIAFFGGLISAFLYKNTKSVLISIIFHVFWNITAVIV